VNALQEAVNKGSLIVNYTGHGGTIGWAEEQILTIPQIEKWRNLNNMPLFVTATCEFGRYDDPIRVSGAELAVLNPKGGAIGLLTTTRPVYSNTNFLVNDAFYQTAFEPVNGQMPHLGEVIRFTKNKSVSGVNNRNFALLGDPSLRLAYPEKQIVLTQMNAGLKDTLRALGKVNLAGEIQAHGNLDNNFNGWLTFKVFDKEIDGKTLGQNGSPMTFRVQDRVLQTGTVAVQNGRFQAEFSLPKDIDYRFGEGKITFYAQHNKDYSDAGGFAKPVIGGSSPAVTADNMPPQISLFMDNEKFVSGGTTDINTTLIARLSDESGINLSQIGIGHAITATLDRVEQVFLLNDYFTPDTNSFKGGTVNYTFRNLSEGRHMLTVKAWDLQNNPATATIDFVVVKNPNVQLTSVFNYPNPFSEGTVFRFTHDRPEEDLNVVLQIYNAQGKLIKTQENDLGATGDATQEIKWDLGGQKIPAGLYLYRLQVRSLLTGANGVFAGKVMVIN
jgi:hypothetical protein